jgi:hypothetical protein
MTKTRRNRTQTTLSTLAPAMRTSRIFLGENNLFKFRGRFFEGKPSPYSHDKVKVETADHVLLIHVEELEAFGIAPAEAQFSFPRFLAA